MQRFTQILTAPAVADGQLTLPFGARQRSRLKAQLDSGEEIGLVLPRGTVLRDGDLLRSDSGRVVRVRAAPEPVSTAFSRDTLVLARACYHLGNRHVQLQIGDTWVRYLHDHVLDALVQNMGLRVFAELAAFEPEAGAYAQAVAPTHHHHEHGHADPR